MLHSKERITEFIDKVLSTDEAFTITDGASSPDWYIQTRIGKSKFIYETKSYHGEDDARIPGFNAEFVAMVTDGKVYMGTPVSYFMSGCERPKNLVFIEEKAVAYQEEGEQMVDEFYKTLKPATIKESDSWRLKDIWKLARSCLMGLNTPEAIIRERLPELLVSVSQAYALEAWRMDLKDIVDTHCKKKEADLAFERAREIQLREKMAEPDLVDPWEVEIAKLLKGMDAKSIAVEFAKNGNIAVAKMEPEKLLTNLLERDYLNEWDFCVGKQGKRLLRTLVGVKSGEDGRLYCSDITRIVYRGKIVFERKGTT